MTPVTESVEPSEGMREGGVWPHSIAPILNIDIAGSRGRHRPPPPDHDRVNIETHPQPTCQPELPESSGASGWRLGC